MSLSFNLQNLREKITEAEKRFHRPAGSVQLLAVSKKQSSEKISEIFAQGQSLFGENYLQEALPKISILGDKNIEWHFIGSIQSNKTRAIAENFSWVHSVSQLKIAERLNAQRPEHLPLLNICIQVNVDEELSKDGIKIDDIWPLAEKLTTFPAIKFRGLMTLPRPEASFEKQRASFQRLFQVFQKLQGLGFAVDTLSMGTSDDYIAAIAEGATMVRIGTAIFGEREKGD